MYQLLSSVTILCLTAHPCQSLLYSACHSQGNIFRRLHEESLTSRRCHPHYQATTSLSFSLRTFDHSISLDTTPNSCSTQSTLTAQFPHRRLLRPLPFFAIPFQLPTSTVNNSTMVLELHTLLPLHAPPTYKSSYYINSSTTHNETWLD